MTHTLDELRSLIMAEDQQIIEHLAARMNLVRLVGEHKRDSAIPVMQPGQVTAVLDRAAARADEHGLSQRFAKELFSVVIKEACRVEETVGGRAGLESDRGGPARALVIGGMGHAASVVTDWLGRLGASCTVADLAPPATGGFAADATRPSKRLSAAVRESDIVVLATPHDVSVGCLPKIGPLLAENAVLVDLLSVKSRYARELTSLNLPCSAVGLNPMYGSGLSPARPRGLAVELRPGRPCAGLLDGLERAGISLLRLATAEDHDRLCARWQALPHAAVLSFGAALDTLAGDAAVATHEFAPPPFQALCALLGRMLATSVQTYAEVQYENEFAAQARGSLGEAVQALVSGGTASWAELWQQAGQGVGADCLLMWEAAFQRLAGRLMDGPVIGP